MSDTHSRFPTIIVTRPSGNAGSLVAELNSELPFAEVRHLPLLSIQPLSFILPSEVFDKAIFISRNAANYFYGVPEAQALLAQTQLFAVGEHSATTVEQLSGQTTLFATPMNAEGLLAMPELRDISQQKILLIKGEGGRELLPESLAARGAALTLLDVYQRKLPDFATQQAIYEAQLKDPVWLISSEQALVHLFRILGLAENRQHRTRVIVSSERLALAAERRGFTIIGQSAGASESQLVQCVKMLNLNQDREPNE